MRRIFAAAAWACPSILAVTPASAIDPTGVWSVGSGSRVYEVLSIHRNARDPGVWSISTARPKGSYVTQSDTVGRLPGATLEPAERRYKLLSSDAHTFRLAIADPAADERADVYRLTMLTPDKLVMDIDGFITLLFDRAKPGAAVAADWAKAPAEVPLVQDWPDNTEMTALFDADQADRKPPDGQKIDWAKVGPADARRLARTDALIAAGALHSGTDYWHAALLFQHGGTSENYLKAHALAIAAAALGNRDASWIAAASLDRYLQSIGKPQVFGTQYRGSDKGMTQDPYDRTALSDGLRATAGVPPLAMQEQRRQEMEARRKAGGQP